MKFEDEFIDVSVLLPVIALLGLLFVQVATGVGGVWTSAILCAAAIFVTVAFVGYKLFAVAMRKNMWGVRYRMERGYGEQGGSLMEADDFGIAADVPEEGVGPTYP